VNADEGTGTGRGHEGTRPSGPTVPGKTLGQVAYEGYCEASGGRSLFNGDLLPPWERQAPAIQDAWDCAAHAVARVVQEDR